MTVEFAGMVPIVLVVLALLWQCVLIGYTFSLAGNAADEAARAADRGRVRTATRRAPARRRPREHLPAEWREKSRSSCSLSGHLWKADVDLSAPVLFPGRGQAPLHRQRQRRRGGRRGERCCDAVDGRLARRRARARCRAALRLRVRATGAPERGASSLEFAGMLPLLLLVASPRSSSASSGTPSSRPAPAPAPPPVRRARRTSRTSYAATGQGGHVRLDGVAQQLRPRRRATTRCEVTATVTIPSVVPGIDNFGDASRTATMPRD